MFALLVIIAMVVAWRWPDARIGLILAVAIITTAVFMVLTSSHSRYVVPGMVFAIIAAAVVPRLQVAAWIMSIGALLNIWAGFGFRRAGWAPDFTYTSPALWIMATVNVVAFGLLIWHSWPRRPLTAPAEARLAPTSNAI